MKEMYVGKQDYCRERVEAFIVPGYQLSTRKLSGKGYSRSEGSSDSFKVSRTVRKLRTGKFSQRR
jgi:hypothetical protein